MKKLILSFFVVGSFTLYAIYYGSSNDTLSYVATPVTLVKSKIATSVKTIKTQNTSTPRTETQQPVQKTVPTPTIPAPTKIVAVVNKGIYKDGEYTGNSVDAYYGYIQVKAVITNGKLSDVVFLDYPQDRGNSVRISNYAMPILKSEAIKMQNSNVNTVSGATDSSGAFKKSLASALAQAKA